MWIRSQSKKELVNITGISIGETNLIRGYEQSCTDGEFWDLGEYSTEENALKVLDMIQELILYTYYGGAEPKKVFQMPQDSEVE